MKPFASAWTRRLSRTAAWSLLLVLGACHGQLAPTQPSGTAALPAATLIFEGEAGIGDGQVHYRSRASGGQTIHLGPGERRWWTFVSAGSAPYALAVRYSNGKEGENEVITVAVDGRPTAAFRDRDTGDSVEGWNTFVSDEAGSATLHAGAHVLSIEISGGDGCVEIDLLSATFRADGSRQP